MRVIGLAALLVTMLIGLVAFGPNTTAYADLTLPLFFIGIIISLYLMMSRRTVA